MDLLLGQHPPGQLHPETRVDILLRSLRRSVPLPCDSCGTSVREQQLKSTFLAIKANTMLEAVDLVLNILCEQWKGIK